MKAADLQPVEPPDRHLDIHLDAIELGRLVDLDCPHELAFEWLAHLVACRVCRHRLARGFPKASRRILDRFLLLRDSGAPAVRIHPRAYDQVFQRVRSRGLFELSTDTRVVEVRRKPEPGPRYRITRSS